MVVLAGACIGFFFGMLIAATAAANERWRGYREAERGLTKMQHDVEQDERQARWQRI